ncbi:hypothetical protein V3C99_000009 [Haemonchus contortus]|uniref:Transposase n=1 Tax=Haemonchus contortus TaxID=6289 RepID=A0A7I4YE80_HAECO
MMLLLLRSSTWNQTTVSSALDSIVQRVKREGRSSGIEAPRLLSTEITSLHLRVCGLSGNNSIDDKYVWLVEHLYDSARKAKGLKDAKKRLSPKTPEQMRQRGIARGAGSNQLKSELAKLCREVIKKNRSFGQSCRV